MSTLAVLTVAVYWSVFGNAFVNYDDPEYVFLNPVVHKGLTWSGVRWAFTTGWGANWHPLTWLSHMADVSLFGLNPAGHHASSLFLHLVNTLLLFLLLERLTGHSARSAFVAALFAVHPAHVQSVAWVAERKDVLSTAFWLATSMAYVAWVRRKSTGRYLLILLFFAAGLMSKPMLVSLPIVLLLLDYWPLGRLDDSTGTGAGVRGTAIGLVAEKAPLFLMTAVAALVTFLVQRAGGAVRSAEIPLSGRVENAVFSAARYLKMLFWPSDLAVFYPHPGTSLSAASVAGASFLLLAISTAAVALRRRAPFLLVGWGWFLVTLLPVIGLVQVGDQAMADRYTYIPFIGLFVVVAWGAPAIVSGWRYARPALAAAAIATALALAVATRAEVRRWKNSETLFLGALERTKDNYVIETNLADFYNETERPADALPHAERSVRLRPDKFEARVNLGRALFLLGRFDEADRRFSEALSLQPGDPLTLNNLARVRFVQGEVADSIRLYRAAIAAKPDWTEHRKRLAIALLLEGQTPAAVEELQRAVAIDPGSVELQSFLKDARLLERNPGDPGLRDLRSFLANTEREQGKALLRRGKRLEAETHLRKAIALAPGWADGHTDLGALLITEERFGDAAEEFRLAVSLDPKSADAHNNLGYALFRSGRRDAAIEQYREALAIRPEFPLARNNLNMALRDRREAGVRRPR